MVSSRQPVPQLPAVAGALPEMRRAGLVTQFDDPVRFHLEVIHELLKVSLWKFTVELIDQRNALLACKVTVANLLRGVVRSAAQTELAVGRIVMKVVDLVVDAVVFAVGTFAAERPRLKADVL